MKMHDDLTIEKESGYTFIEVLVTIIIMGTIVLVVNVIMVSIIRVSYTTDTRIKMRQNMDFATEVFRRTARSSESIGMVANPAISDCGVNFSDPANPYHMVPRMMLEGGVDNVIFYVDQDSSPNPLSDCKPVLKAQWTIGGSTHFTNLLSPSEVSLEDDPAGDCGLIASSGFDVIITTDPATRLVNIVMTLTANSAQETSPGVPLVDCVVKEVSILRQPREM